MTMIRLMAATGLVILMLLSGCVAADLAEGRPGTDLTQVREGAIKSDIEGIVGEPQRCWITDAGVTHCLYSVYAGRESKPLMALGWLSADIFTVGMLELAGKDLETEEDKDAFYGAETTNVIVSYDGTGQALGVFREFDLLPDDGIPKGD